MMEPDEDGTAEKECPGKEKALSVFRVPDGALKGHTSLYMKEAE